jgi:transposase
LHHQDATHLETTPSLGRVWHRWGTHPTVPAAGTNRRVTPVGRVAVLGRGRVEVGGAGQDAACFRLYLEALAARHVATGRALFLALDQGSAHTRQASLAELAARAEWLHRVWLARYRPHLNRNEHAWRVRKRDARSPLARSLREFVDGILAGRRRLGGERLAMVDRVPAWFMAGQRRPPGRPPGRPKGAKDRQPRTRRCKNLPAPT